MMETMIEIHGKTPTVLIMMKAVMNDYYFDRKDIYSHTVSGINDSIMEPEEMDLFMDKMLYLWKMIIADVHDLYDVL